MNGIWKCIVGRVLLIGMMASGCSLTTGPSANDILKGMARVPEDTIIRDGLPTYLIMMETMLSRAPEDPKVLEAAARLYSLYGGYFVDEQERAEILTTRALDYALRSADKNIAGMGKARSGRYEDFECLINDTRSVDVATLFFVGSVWLDWVRVRKDDLEAVADLPKIQLIMQRVIALDAEYQNGMATLFLALLASMEYGENEQIRDYFILAVEQAAGKHVMADYFFGLWQIENGEAEEGCSRLHDILHRHPKGAKKYSLYNDFTCKRASKELEEFMQSGKCHISDERGE